MVILNPSLSTITLNVNRFNSLTKGHKVNEWILKKDPSTCFAQETHVRFKNTHLQKAKGCKKIFQANSNQKGARVVIFMADRIHSLSKTVTKDKARHFMIKGQTARKI